MAVESIAAASAAPPPRVTELGPATAPEPAPDLAGRFDAALTNAVGGAGEVPPALRDMLGMLDKVNGEARSVTEYARTAEMSGSEMTPGEVVQLTMRCQEFMFHCQLTSNIANRSAEGVQQLFRQQG
ncbi:hypothetical protein [Novosphingobium sp.]|uniref:hypothetical protein n=1 Tax=Novosphingobium sp. TaxID=1874826 RepID=UPI002FE1E1BC